MVEEECKSVLIVNDSADAQITFYLYPRWDAICWLSTESIILKPGKKQLHSSKKGFQFKIVARFKDQRPKKTIVELRQWDGDKLFRVIDDQGTSSPTFIEEILTDQVEKRICLRKRQRDKELMKTRGQRNLYAILGLDMKKVREMSTEQQSEAIKSGFHTQIRIWHSDHYGGDDEVTKEILLAYETLQNEEKRARYNNLADYDRGWLSAKRYKVILKPDCVTEEQKRTYRKRLLLSVLSVVLLTGGIAATVATAGLATPALVAIGAACGGGLVSAGLLSLQHTVRTESVLDECRLKDWAMKAGIGFLGGAITGGAAAGITAGVTGIGSIALELAAVTTGQYIGIGAVKGAVGGLALSVAADLARFVDGKDVTLRQACFRAACGAVVGAAAGAVGGVVTKAIWGAQASAASANPEGDVGEQVVILTGRKRIGNALTRTIPKMVTENGTESVVSCPLQMVEERLDESVKNRNLLEHVKHGLMNFAINTAVNAVRDVAASLAHIYKVDRILKKEIKYSLTDDEAKPSEIKSLPASYEPLENEEPPSPVPENVEPVLEEVGKTELETDEQTIDGKVKYISEGLWRSKMIVTFFQNGKMVTKEVTGSGTSIDIPCIAREIKVRFQVMRPFWGDVCKYDRSRKSWFKPYEPHIFQYDTPPIRTYTISGNLWWEAVMRVSNEYHDETKEM
ncbi:uncharacterized protein [Montipora foliosa]|uniref:uncharacterized protein n=1 Tax=Montipora foliosa TaxID=591990 RepID=UPI0035F2029A